MIELMGWQWRRHSRQFSVLLVLLLQFSAFAIALILMWQRFHDAQAAGIRSLSFSHDVLTPLYGVIAALLFIGAPLHGLSSFTQARQQHLLSWWQHSPHYLSLIGSRYLVACASQLLFLIPSSVALFSFAIATDINLKQWLMVSAGNILLLLAVQALTLAFSAALAQWLSSLLLSYGLLALWLGLDLLPGRYGVFGVWQAFRDQQLSLAAIAYFSAITIAALWFIRLRWWPHRRRDKVFLFLPLLLLLSSALPLPQWNFAASKSLMISPATQQWLAQQTTAVSLTVVASDSDVQQDYLQQLRELPTWHRALTVEAKHPAELSASLREQLPSGDGLLISTLQRHDWIALPQPQLTLGVIIRLQHLTSLANTWLIFSEGHGERKIFGDDMRDLGVWSSALQQNGYTLAPFDWRAAAVPNNTRVLVLAHLQTPLLPSELAALFQYLNGGGHLLWLRDPDDADMPLLEQYLGVRKLAGTVLDRDGMQRGTPHPAIALVDRYNNHDSVSSLSVLAALPWAAALQINPSNFNAQIILPSSPHAVLQTGAELDQIDPNLVPQHYALGVVLQRDIAKQSQRIIVLGDSHFAANNAIGNYGNQALAMQLLRWLALADAAPPLADFSAPDAVMLPSLTQTLFLLLCWPLLLPLFLLSWFARRQWRWRQLA